MPKHLHQDFYNVYSFCSWADDLGDEIGDPQESLRLLAWWRRRTAGYVSQAKPSILFSSRCASTVAAASAFPIEPFDRLIRAFEQDQTVTRYRNFDELFGYCVNSANPVGHLVLCTLAAIATPSASALSDSTCTRLQLANFWQDVTVDLQKDRVYLPLDSSGEAWLHGRGTLRAAV